MIELEVFGLFPLLSNETFPAGCLLVCEAQGRDDRIAG